MKGSQLLAIVEKELATVRKHLERIEHPDEKVDHDSNGDLADQADGHTQTIDVVTRTSMLHRQLAELSDAKARCLKAMDAEVTCAACGKAIDDERLELVPENALCCTCQAIEERRRRRSV